MKKKPSINFNEINASKSINKSSNSLLSTSFDIKNKSYLNENELHHKISYNPNYIHQKFNSNDNLLEIVQKELKE